MGRKKVRIVVVVRCPLCGGWINGHSYSLHLDNVHLYAPGGALEGLEPPERLDVSDSLEEGLKRHSEVPGDPAGEVLRELGRRRARGQDVSLGFELFE